MFRSKLHAGAWMNLFVQAQEFRSTIWFHFRLGSAVMLSDVKMPNQFLKS